MRGNTCARPLRRERERALVVYNGAMNMDRAAARDRSSGNHEQIEQQLNLIFRQQNARHIPRKLRALIADKAACDTLCIARVDCSARRTGSAKSQTRELQAR